MTQNEFRELFTGVTEGMQKTYEAQKAEPSLFYVEELSELTGVSQKDLRSKQLKKGDIKKFPEKANKVNKVNKENKGENNAASTQIDLLAAGDLEFRGLLVAQLSTIQANLKALNNKVAQINEEVTGVKSTITLAELEQTTQTVAKMLKEELEKALLKP